MLQIFGNRLMVFSMVRGLATLCVICCLTSCSQGYRGPVIKKVPVVPVKGSVTVDGQPEAGVKVRCIPLGAFEFKEVRSALSGETNDDGEFTLGTYDVADGLPPGEFAVTLMWPTTALKRVKAEVEEQTDRLKGKYLKVEQSPLKFKVEEGSEPIVLDLIKLKTK